MASVEGITQKRLQDKNCYSNLQGKDAILEMCDDCRSNSNVTWLVEFTEYMTLGRAKGLSS